MNNPRSPLVLTLKLDFQTFDFFDRLRQHHFPADRNFLPAHITLFHRLVDDQAVPIRQTIHEYCSHTPALTLTFPNLRSLGGGVAVEVACNELIELRQQLAKTWHDRLTRQDQQSYRPHITIQNKVPSDVAQHLYADLSNSWKLLEGRGEGLLLWYYQGGPWELVEEFPFRASTTNVKSLPL